MEDSKGHEELSRSDSPGDKQAVVLGENMSCAVADPRVGQLTRIRVPQIFLVCIKLLTADQVFNRKCMGVQMGNFYCLS